MNEIDPFDNNPKVKSKEEKDEERLWYEVEPALLIVLVLLIIAAIANWRGLHGH